MFHTCTRLNNFPVFRKNRDIEFALRCMDVLATNAQISMNRNLMLKAECEGYKIKCDFYLLQRFYIKLALDNLI